MVTRDVNMSYVLCGMRGPGRRAVCSSPQRESTHADGTPQPVKYLFPGLQQGGNRSKSFWCQRDNLQSAENGQACWSQRNAKNEMASAVSGLRTGAWALAVGDRGFIHCPSGSGWGGLSFPTGHLNRSYIDPNYSAGGLLLKKKKKKTQNLKDV